MRLICNSSLFSRCVIFGIHCRTFIVGSCHTLNTTTTTVNSLSGLANETTSCMHAWWIVPGKKRRLFPKSHFSTVKHTSGDFLSISLLLNWNWKTLRAIESLKNSNIVCCRHLKSKQPETHFSHSIHFLFCSFRSNIFSSNLKIVCKRKLDSFQVLDCTHRNRLPNVVLCVLSFYWTFKIAIIFDSIFFLWLFIHSAFLRFSLNTIFFCFSCSTPKRNGHTHSKWKDDIKDFNKRQIFSFSLYFFFARARFSSKWANVAMRTISKGRLRKQRWTTRTHTKEYNK